MPKNILKFTGLLFIALVSFLVGSVIFQKKALAYSTTTPIQASSPTQNSANVHGSSSGYQPWFVVGRGEYDGTNSNAKVYVPVGVGAKLTIVNGGGENCPLDIATNSGPPQVGYQLTNTDPDETNNSDNAWWFNTPTSNTADGNTNCHNVIINIPARTAADSSSHPGHTNYIVYYFTATMTNPCGDPNTCNTIKAWKLSVTLTGPSAYQPYVGLSRNVNQGAGTNGKTTVGIYGSGAQSGSYNWDYGVQFAPFCDEDPSLIPSPVQIGIYDIDYKVYSTRPNAGTLYPDYVQQDTDLTAEVLQDGRTDPNFGWGAAGGPAPKLVGPDWNPVANQNLENSLPLRFNYDNSHRYLLDFKDLSYRNLVQVRLPFDQFDALGSTGNACNNKNDAACSLNAGTAQSSKTYSQLAPNATVQFGVAFKNTGSATWDPSQSPPYQWSTSVDGNPPNSPNSVNTLTRSGSYYSTGNFTFTAPSTPNTTKTITFQMLQSTQPAFGTKCTLILKTGPPPGTSSIDASCEETRLTVNDPTPSANPVPVSVVITNAGNAGDNHTYSTTVALDPTTHIGQKTVKTFDMWIPGMWPSNSYNFQLIVDGVAQSGATDTISSCLQVGCNAGGYATDAEPGQNGKGNVTVHFTNDAGRSSGWPLNGSDGGYTFAATANPGFVVLSPNPQNTSSGFNAWNGGSSGNPVDTDVTVTVSIREDWTGDFTVTLQGPPGTPSVGCSGSGTPQTRPYFQATQGDVDVGGGFGDATGKCTAGTLSYISPINTNPYNAGLRAYANQGAGTGSSGDFGVLALGYNVSGNNVGFYSKNNEIFAAPGVVGEMGGLLNQSAETDWHCVNDFFLKTRLPGQTDLGSNPTINVDSLSTQTQYTATGNVTLTSLTGSDCSSSRPGGDIQEGEQFTLYVSGNVTIANNICYAPTYRASTRSNVPYFSLIVQGNITVNYNVNQIDGLYVAQPLDATNGIFSTCDGFCPNNKLTVNGAILAQTVRLNREHGTMGPLGNDLNGITTEPAEVFNYIPAMIIGQPYFSPNYSNIQALYSLPPVF